MDDARFDAASRMIASRRTLLGGLVAVVSTTTGAVIPESLAKKHKKKRHKKPKHPPAGPTAYADASCNATGGGVSAVRVAQTFRALRSGQLTSATAFLTANLAGLDLDVEIWSVDSAGRPNAVLAGATVANIPASSEDNPRPVTATFSGPATVVAGLRYALVVTGAAADFYIFDCNPGNPCPDGQTYSAPSATGAFSPRDGFDLRFATVVTA